MGGLADFRVEQLASTYRAVMSEDFGDLDADDFVEWIPIEWYTGLHGLSTTIRRLGPCNLPTIPVLRRINNEMLSDVLYYFTAYHGQKIIDHVTLKFNTQFRKFMASNPSFNGKIGIFAHSLGGIITYDILHHQPEKLGGAPPKHSSPRDEIKYPPLEFQPDFLFNLGSPVSAVIVMRGLKIEEYQIPSFCTFFNIFHLYDPFGYRIEPLFCPSNADIPPIPILRPSSTRTTAEYVASFYSELVSNYLSSFPVPSWPGLSGEYLSALPFPSWPSMPSMPVMPAMPDLSSLSASIKSTFGLGGSAGDKRKREDDDEEVGPDADTLEEEDEPAKKRQKQSLSPEKLVELGSSFKDGVNSFFSRVVNRGGTASRGISPTGDKDESIPPHTAPSPPKAAIPTGIPLPKRYDYFVQEKVNINQYLVGLRCHFQYWHHHDVMYAVLKCFKVGPHALDLIEEDA